MRSRTKAADASGSNRRLGMRVTGLAASRYYMRPSPPVDPSPSASRVRKVSFIERCATYSRQKTALCRALAKKASKPEVIGALGELAGEFDDMTAELERHLPRMYNCGA